MGDIIIAIDPGSEQSAFCLYDGAVLDMGIYPNTKLIHYLADPNAIDLTKCSAMAIEMIACYGMPVGKTVFETCVWIGRFIEAYRGEHQFVYRRDVKHFLCNSVRAKDSNVRQALIDRFPATGGGKTPQIGTKAKPGPLYGFKADMWAALGVAITYAAQQESQNE